MTGLQLLHELEGLRAQDVDLQDVHLAIINGSDCILPVKRMMSRIFVI